MKKLPILLAFLVYQTSTNIEARSVSSVSASCHTGTENTDKDPLESDSYFEGDLFISPELKEEYYYEVSS